MKLIFDFRREILINMELVSEYWIDSTGEDSYTVCADSHVLKFFNNREEAQNLVIQIAYFLSNSKETLFDYEKDYIL